MLVPTFSSLFGGRILAITFTHAWSEPFAVLLLLFGWRPHRLAASRLTADLHLRSCRSNEWLANPFTSTAATAADVDADVDVGTNSPAAGPPEGCATSNAACLESLCCAPAPPPVLATAFFEASVYVNDLQTPCRLLLVLSLRPFCPGFRFGFGITLEFEFAFEIVFELGFRLKFGFWFMFMFRFRFRFRFDCACGCKC